MMTIFYGIVRIFIGIFFMISGLVKLNDPLGFSYKLEEYFSAGVLDIEFLIPFALPIALLTVILEVLVGFSLILGYLPKLTLGLLLGMIIFFTFLTFYSAYFNKVTDCGCFGDALPLTPWQSFWKDVGLLILIVFMVWKGKLLQPLFAKASHKWFMLGVFILCLGLGYFVLMHLPVIDFRAYKVGTNILQAMKPDPQKPAVYEYIWKFRRGTEEYTISTDGSYPNTDGEFVSYELRLVDPGYVPPIQDFSIVEPTGEDKTEEFLQKPKQALVVAYNLSKSDPDGMKELAAFQKRATAAGYEIILLTATTKENAIQLIKKYGLSLPIYHTDETVLKTMVRSNPGVILMEKGTVIAKSPWNDFDQLMLR